MLIFVTFLVGLKIQEETSMELMVVRNVPLMENRKYTKERSPPENMFFDEKAEKERSINFLCN